MNDYITETMARYGCGASDVKAIHGIITSLSDMAQDVLDGWYNFGRATDLLPAARLAASDLRDNYSDDDLDCMEAYINAYRSTVGGYIN